MRQWGFNMRKNHRVVFESIALVTLVVCSVGCNGKPGVTLAGSDLDAIRDASRAYTQAWLANDEEAVMSTFVAEPVLSPSGMPYLEGQDAARSFWFPDDGVPTTVTRFETEEVETGGSGDWGFLRGTFVLDFEYDGKNYTNRGKYLHLLKRTDDSKWKISHRFWNDLPAE